MVIYPNSWELTGSAIPREQIPFFLNQFLSSTLVLLVEDLMTERLPIPRDFIAEMNFFWTIHLILDNYLSQNVHIINTHNKINSLLYQTQNFVVIIMAYTLINHFYCQNNYTNLWQCHHLNLLVLRTYLGL